MEILNRPPWPGRTFLGRLGKAAAAHAVELGRPYRFSAHEYLLRSYEPSDHVFLLLSGLVKVVGESGDRDVLVSLRIAGDVVGELAATNQKHRIATVVACDTVRTRRISAAEWQTFLMTFSEASTAYFEMLGDRLRSATQRQLDLASRRPAVRVARILLEFCGDHGHRTARGVEIDVAVSQVELASAAGCSEALLRRILKDLRDLQIVATEYRRYVVLDVPRLRQVADVETDVGIDIDAG